jgi:hypothetical protein
VVATSAVTVQLDLFGEADQAEQAASKDAQVRADWTARFERADWIAPYDTAGGTPKGTVLSGWRCPDPDCAEVEVNSFVLSINHGFDPDVPGWEPFDGRCAKLRRLEAQRQHEDKTAATEGQQ